MAQITITIPDNKIELIKKSLDYQEQIPDETGNLVPNPQTPKSFLTDWLKDQLKRRVRVYEQRNFEISNQYTDLEI